MKSELIDTDFSGVSAKSKLKEILNAATSFFSQYVGETTIVPTSETAFDITYQGDELGSYGIRKCDFLEWVYGTAVALPRLSNVIQKYGLPQKQNT
jgi:hypothetical protein